MLGPLDDDAFVEEVKRHLYRADENPRFADMNHIDGVLAEEIREFQREVDRGDSLCAIQELLDVAAVAIRAARQIWMETRK